MWPEVQPNGKVKFVERYLNPLTGKTAKVSVTFDKDTASIRKQAQNVLRDKIDAKLKSLCLRSFKTELSLSELVEKYRVDQKNTVAKSTYTRNYFAMESLLKILGADTLVSQLSAGYIRECFLATGESPGTLNERLTRLKALIRWGYSNDYIDDVRYLDKLNRFKDRSRHDKVQDKFLESEELKLLLKHMSVDWWRMLTALTALSGMRIGEAIALNNSDVDLKNRKIHITKTYDPVNHTTTPPKTSASIRDVYMQDELLTLCKQIKTYMLRQKLMNGYDTELFLSNSKGSHLNYYSFNKYLSENTLALLDKKATTHFMRHTHVALMAENGVSLDIISRRLGHNNSKITKEIYYHVTKQKEKKDNEAISAIQIL